MLAENRLPKATHLDRLHLLAGIAPPSIRGDVCADDERTKQETNVWSAGPTMSTEIPAMFPTQHKPTKV